MQTALITNLNLNSRTGLELHTLQVARQLQNNGYEVTCFCLCAAYPLLRNFELNNIEVLSMGEENKLKDHYDLFIAQHKLVSEYVYSLPRINFSSVYISILGVATEHEGLPFFSEKANGILAVSEEVKTTSTRLPKSKILIFRLFTFFLIITRRNTANMNTSQTTESKAFAAFQIIHQKKSWKLWGFLKPMESKR